MNLLESKLLAVARFVLTACLAVAGTESERRVETDVDIISARRKTAMMSIVGQTSQLGNITKWLGTLDNDGKWPDSEINYASGCTAQRSNWPIYIHWERIVSMAAIYNGGSTNSSDDRWVGNNSLGKALSRSIDWWFSRDFQLDGCLDDGGGDSCPCGTPGLWGPNWYSNVILIPNLVVQTCLLLEDTLTKTQASNCTHLAMRAQSPFYRPNPPGFVSGANILDMSKIAVDQALRVKNATLLSEAYERIHAQMAISSAIAVKEDGIKPDGTFGQHQGLSYAGNYGKDYVNAVLNLEEAAYGTRFAANQSAQNSFASLIDGNRWAIVRNTVTGVLHWDLSVLSRFIALPTADLQATGSININLTQVAHLGELWKSDPLTGLGNTLNENGSNANAGGLVGNRMFWSNDYMVHRGKDYVSTLKMFSNRTKNTEFVNSQNPYGFHLSDGTLYTYLRGNEYEDIAAAWDWSLIPGVTVDYSDTVPSGDSAEVQGTQRVVGGASTGSIGVAAMRYRNPVTQAFSFSKAYFFLDDDVQHVTIANITRAGNASVPPAVYSVLDQKRRSGPIYVDGKALGTAGLLSAKGVKTLWHDRVGYAFGNASAPGSSAPQVSVRTGVRAGNWSAISASTQPPARVDLFAAWVEHANGTEPLSYTVFPAVEYDAFWVKRAAAAAGVYTVRNDADVAAVRDEAHSVFAAVFWNRYGGTVVTADGEIELAVDANAIVIFRADTGGLTVADPSQSVGRLTVAITIRNGPGAVWTKTVRIALPPGPGGYAGSSVTQIVY